MTESKSLIAKMWEVIDRNRAQSGWNRFVSFWGDGKFPVLIAVMAAGPDGSVNIQHRFHSMWVPFTVRNIGATAVCADHSKSMEGKGTWHKSCLILLKIL